MQNYYNSKYICSFLHLYKPWRCVVLEAAADFEDLLAWQIAAPCTMLVMIDKMASAMNTIAIIIHKNDTFIVSISVACWELDGIHIGSCGNEHIMYEPE